MSDNLTPDYDMANQYLDAVSGSKKEQITFQFFNDKDKKTGTPSFRHLKRNPDYAFLHNKQKAGYGIFAMVNAGNGKGRSAKNVVKVRAIFIDLDGSPWEPAADLLRPHLRVESSPGRWHLCWLVEDCSLGQFKGIQQALARKFDGDKSCCDLPRVLRVPGFWHLKKNPVMTVLVEDNKFPRYTAQQVIDGLGLELEQVTTGKPKREIKTGPAIAASSLPYAYISPTTGEMIDLAKWAAQNPGFDIVKNLNAKYALGQVVDGKQHIICPFAHEHTDTSLDYATFIVNATPPGHTSFNIHCMHSHCADRDRLEFLQIMFQDGWLSTVLTPAPLPPKRVQKIYYPAVEIASSLQLRVLNPDEFRILLHLMHLAWSAEDGTLPDDNWMIARSLGLEESDWKKYRTTLNRAGWLDEIEGRLTNDILKREFANAQNALDSFRVRGQKGGKNSR